MIDTVNDVNEAALLMSHTHEYYYVSAEVDAENPIDAVEKTIKALYAFLEKQANGQ